MAAQETSGAIVDATFRHTADRAAFLAAHGATPLVAIECRTPRAVRRRRAGARAATAGAVSDADAAIALAQEMDPLDDIGPGDHVTVRGDADVDALLDAVADALDRRLIDHALARGA